MDYKSKYLKYKTKYLGLKNSIKGGYINPWLVDKFQLCEFHGSLDIDDTFTVPRNVYIIQSNTCSLSNNEYLKSLFVSQDKYQYSDRWSR
jgi:hypothetical protein